jgi:hypothetical protein
MPNTMQGPNTPFIEVNYAAKIVFTLQHDGQERADLHDTWLTKSRDLEGPPGFSWHGH